jgi:brefeldin A-inhibited guanine nucleotide-exchange protein
MKRNAEQNFELGAVKFTLSLKSGLNFFIDNDFVERDVKKLLPLFFITNRTHSTRPRWERYRREPDAAFVKGC